MSDSRSMIRLVQTQQRLDRHRNQIDGLIRRRDELIVAVADEGTAKSTIAKRIGLSRVGVHKVLERVADSETKGTE